MEDVLMFGWSSIQYDTAPETGYLTVQRWTRYVVPNYAIYCPQVGASLFSPVLN